MFCHCSSAVEQRFRKPQVLGSSPSSGFSFVFRLLGTLCISLTTLVGCGSGANTGDLGKAVFNATSCGGVLSDLNGCDLKRTLAIGGLVDVRATRSRDSAPLLLRSDLPSVVKVTELGGTQYTLTGQSTGTAVLTAYDSSGDVDHLTIQVAEISQIAYTTLSNGFGQFKLAPNGDIDGTFALAQNVTNFSLIFAGVDTNTMPLLGRDSFTYELSAGLSFQPGKDAPHAMQFDLVRPAPGDYTLLVRAKFGGGRFKMLIRAN